MVRHLLALACVGVLLGVVALPFSSSALAEEVGVTAGFSEIDVTPKVEPGGKPVYVAGFGHDRKATGVHDKLFARAFVVGDGKTKVAIVSVDLVGLFVESCDRVRKQLPGFAHVVVTCTHNHEGPDTLGLWGSSPLQSGVDAAYLAEAERKLVQAVKEADAARVPVTGRIGTVQAPELLHDSRIPNVLHDDLVVLQLQGKDGKNAGLVVQWNCHPETLGGKNTLVSADYVGYTVDYLKAKYRCPVVYLTGTVGGLMTSLHVPIKSEKGEALEDGTYEKTARYGLLLGKATDRAVAAAKPARLHPVSARSRGIYLPLANPLYVVAQQVGVFRRQAYLWKGNPREAEAVGDIVDPKKKHAIRSEVGYLELGQLGIACIPGEIYPELVLDKVVAKPEAGADFPDAPREPGIYAQMKGPYRMLIGLANDEVGYILPKRQWDEKPPFCYGRKTKQYGEVNSLGSETAPLLCEAFRDMMAGKK